MAFALGSVPAWSQRGARVLCSKSGIRVGRAVSVGSRLRRQSAVTMSFGKPVAAGSNVLVVGGNRGLGLEVTRDCVKRGATVYATCRKSNKELDDAGATVIEDVNVADYTVGQKVAAALPADQVFDSVIVVAGLFTTDTLEDLKPDNIVKMYEVCAIGPTALASELIKAGKLKEGSKYAMITSEGGAIGLRSHSEGGDNYGHHASKAAQNMMGKILSIDAKPKGISVRMIHPGFLKTEMTQHYSFGYEEFNAIPPSEAAPKIVDAVDMMTLENTGQFIAPMGTYSLGFSANRGVVGELAPFSELPW